MLREQLFFLNGFPRARPLNCPSSLFPSSTFVLPEGKAQKSGGVFFSIPLYSPRNVTLKIVARSAFCNFPYRSL